MAAMTNKNVGITVTCVMKFSCLCCTDVLIQKILNARRNI